MSRVRIWLRRAEARAAAGECGWARRAGRLADGATRACDGEVETHAAPGKAGQVDGDLTDVFFDAALAMAVAASMVMAQWCAPWRRQQAGRDASSLAPSVAARGPSEKNRTSRMESARRMLP